MSTNDPDQSSGSPAFAARDYKAGAKIAGCYVLKSLLYETQATVVWHAQDELLNRDVTLHFVPDAVVTDQKALGELRNEVKLNRQLIHPGIVRVYDLVEDVDCAAISMDHFDAETLANLKKKKPGSFFNPNEIRSWLAELTQAVEDAHRANLLHRHLTPENVLIRKDGSALLCGFGISRTILDSLARLQPGRKDPDLVYMSPQALDGEQASRSDDIYSFGVLVYDLLTGKPPFDPADAVSQVRKLVPPRMSDKRAELKIEGEPIPGGWEKTVAAALVKHTEGRPAAFGDIASQMKLGKAEPIPLAESIPSAVKPSAGPVAAAAPTATAEAKLLETAGKGEKSEKSDAGKPTPGKPAPGKRETEWRPKERRREKRSEPEPGKPRQKEEPRLSPFGGMVEKGGGEGPGKGSGLGVIVAVVILVIVGIGLFSMLTGSHEEEKATAGKETPGLRVGEVEPAPAESPVEESTPVPEETVAAAASPEPTMAMPIEGAPEEMQKAAAEAEMVYQQRLNQQQAAEAALETKRKALEEGEATMAEIQKASQESSESLSSNQDTAEDLETELQAAREAVEEKEKALQEQRQKIASLEEEMARKKEAADTAKTAVESAKLEASEAEKALSQAEQGVAAAAAERDRLTSEAAQAAKAAQEAMAAAEAEKKAQEDAAAREKARLQEEELKRRAAEAERAAQEAASLAEQARKALEEAERLRKASEEAQMRARQAAEKPGEGVPAVPTPSPSPAEGTPAPAGVQATPAALPEGAGVAFENSLGMKFVPVGDVSFSIWPTRIRDYEVFAKATGRGEGRWRNPGFKQGPDHPVVNVSWLDAIAFCQWLTEREQASGNIKVDQNYRLPTDKEWSVAVGLPDEKGEMPDERDMGIPDVYPWGTQWPPPKGAGNYTGEETGSDVAIKGYDDGFVWTAPVGNFNPNPFGLYDLGGNVWEWVMDWWNSKQTAKVLRGASWYNGALKLSLLSSCRVHASPDSSTDNYGFRVVLAKIPRASRN